MSQSAAALPAKVIPKFLKRAEFLEYLVNHQHDEDIFKQVYEFAEASGVRIRHDQQECMNWAADMDTPQSGTVTPRSDVQDSPRGAPSSEAMAMTIAETGYESDLNSSTLSALGGTPRASEATSENTSVIASETASETASENVSEAATSSSSTSKFSRRSRSSRSSRNGKVVPVPFTRARDGTYRMSLGNIFPDDEMSQPAPTRESLVCRLLLSSGRGGTAHQREFSGLLLDSATWLPLATPPPAFNLRPATRAVDALLAAGAYDIIRVDDGTVITLYQWSHPRAGELWGMASNNGYDVSSLHWMGSKTYAEVFYDLAVRRYPEFAAATGMRVNRIGKTTRLTFSSLDPNYSYTIGFRHHNFHPVIEDPERMWSIQALPNYARRAAAPADAPIAPPPVLAIPAQAIIEPAQLASELGVEQLTLAHLRTAGVCAFETAIAHISGAARVFPADLAFNYGYILRMRPAARLSEGAAAAAAAFPDHDHVLVETPLLTRIRRIVYERAPRTIRDRLTADERQQFSALRAFLTQDRRDFLLIFPAWASRFAAFEKFTNAVVGEAIHILRQRIRTPPSRDPRPSSMAGHIAQALLNHISKKMALTAPHRDIESILRDRIVVPENAYLFLRAMLA